MRVDGTQKLIKKIRKFGQDAENKISAVTQINAEEIATKATQKLSSYTDVDPDGKIAQSINVEPKTTGLLKYSIGVNQLPMGAYLEFGTGVFVQVAPEWKDIAWQFYVNGKGWLQPHPYLYPAYMNGKEQYEKDLKDLFQRLTERFNNQ